MAETIRIIKKYPNRRLYDTETSTYITLADVKELAPFLDETVILGAFYSPTVGVGSAGEHRGRFLVAVVGPVRIRLRR